MNTYENWLVDINDRVATLTLNRPKKKNSFGGTTLPELSEICKEIESMPEIAAVVLQGAGDGFSAGVDLNGMFGVWQKPKEEIIATFLEMKQHLNSLKNLNKPTIAKIHGYCIAGGLALAMICDFRVASTDAYFSLSEVRLSLLTFMITQSVKKVCGVNNAKEIILLADDFGTDKALKFNLINEAVEPNELDAAVKKYTERFKKLPILAVAANKRIINEDLGENQSLEKEVEEQQIIMKSRDFQEAIQSFMQKREPNYIGK